MNVNEFAQVFYEEKYCLAHLHGNLRRQVIIAIASKLVSSWIIAKTAIDPNPSKN